MTRRIGLASAALIAACATAVAQAAPARRGPTVPVIRPSLETFPDRARTGLEGPIGVARVAALAWEGPRLDGEWRPDLATDNSHGWMRPAPGAWDSLRSQQNGFFEGSSGRR